MTYKICPFVKWAGGKKQLVKILKNRIPRFKGKYYEPFIGGGALFLDLQPKQAVINDINEQLVNVYVQLKNDNSAVISAIKSYDMVDCNLDYFLSLRAEYNKKIAAHELDAQCAALTIWINKHCFNGLYRVNSKGFFNVPYNNKLKGPSINETNLINIGQYLRNADIEIHHNDFEAVCSDVKQDDFVYFDSPYIPISKTAKFTDYSKDGFVLEDHKRLASLFRLLDDLGAYVMLSNHNVELVYQLYEGFNIEEVDVKRNINSVASKRSGKEVIITNYTIL